MIDHSKCDHPRTPSARSKCRRAQGGDSTPKVKRSGGATPKAPDDDNYGQTPGRKEDECHVCHVERLVYLGTDAWTNLQVMVGEKCRWRLKKDCPIQVVDPNA